MRVYLEGDATAEEFLSMLLSIGNGELTADESGLVTIPPGCGELVNGVEAISGKVFPNLDYPTDFLNSLDLSGMPPHNLKLKVGCPVMLLRNLDAPDLFNGTRLIIKQILPHVLEATILTGLAQGKDIFILRIPLIPSDLPFQFKRLQFPLNVCFAISINKSQG
ncbi:uncharacterized protein LOC134195086 [Corticium candelabrum]|uniref:uncharacterized protein LOC134195086 n=1 Tax=Corticium candelabrum TaxID=121492 RepID=UPI002E27093D|nr:uncharacterized protein LOC134195086 [Corticium candelabrum]